MTHPLPARRSIGGFTLIEISIVLVVLGLIAASFLPFSKTMFTDKGQDVTANNIKTISTALSNYRAVNGRYPCPASLTADRSNPAYGRETDCSLANVGPGSCANGICVKSGAREIDIDPSPLVTNMQRPRVRIGAIPFRQLNLQEEESIDGYGNRLTYVVTERLATPGQFQIDHGAVAILNDQNVSIIKPDASGHFLVLSYGPDGAGAYTAAGTQNPCPSTNPNNCSMNGHATFILPQSGRNFDDVLSYFTQGDLPLWKVGANNPNDISQITTGNVGFNIASAASQKGQLSSAVRVQGSLLTDELCNTSLSPGSTEYTQCFSSSLFAGALDSDPTDDKNGMKCPEDDKDFNGSNGDAIGPYMVGIENGSPLCSPVIRMECGAGQIISSINSAGVATCGSPPTTTPCGSYRPTGCNGNYIQINGQDVVIGESLDSYQQNITETTTIDGQPRTIVRNYRCQAGSWIVSTVSGSCAACSPSVSHSTTTYGGNCAYGYTGNTTRYTTTTTYSCVNGINTPSSSTVTETITPTTDTNACTCSPKKMSYNYTCSTGYTGNGSRGDIFRVCGANGTPEYYIAPLGTASCPGPGCTQISPGAVTSDGAVQQYVTNNIQTFINNGVLSFDCTCQQGGTVATSAPACAAGETRETRNLSDINIPSYVNLSTAQIAAIEAGAEYTLTTYTCDPSKTFFSGARSQSLQTVNATNCKCDQNKKEVKPLTCGTAELGTMLGSPPDFNTRTQGGPLYCLQTRTCSGDGQEWVVDSTKCGTVNNATTLDSTGRPITDFLNTCVPPTVTVKKITQPSAASPDKSQNRAGYLIGSDCGSNKPIPDNYIGQCYSVFDSTTYDNYDDCTCSN